MITLHHLNNSRSQRILWLLEELGLPYQIEFYERDPKTILAPPALKKVHPLGKSPVIQDDETGITLAESGAIIEYLIRTYGRDRFMPEEDSAEFWQYLYWMHYAEGSLMPPLVLRLVFYKLKTSPMPFFVKPIARKLADKVLDSFVMPNVHSNMAFIEQHLESRDWLCGDVLTGADVQLSFPLEASVARGLTDQRYPRIRDYVQRIQARPAYQAALKKGGVYDYA